MNQIQNTSEKEKLLRLIEVPNLPRGRVRLLLAGERYIPRLNLSQWGIQALPLSFYAGLEPLVADHADMQVLHLYGNKIVSNSDILCKVMSLYREYISRNACKGSNLSIVAEAGKHRDLFQYPESAAYNVLILGKYAIFNPNCVDRTVWNLLKTRYLCVPVRQGYARCSSCIVGENAVITADPGIKKTLTGLGIDVLDITPGYIQLPGYAYGFIGGASFKISEHQLAFTGRLDMHPDYFRMLGFLEEHDTEPVFLSDEPAFDMGSATLLLEIAEEESVEI